MSIASPDGGLAKTAKSELLPLQEEAFQQWRSSPRRDMARQVFLQITNGLVPGDRVDFVIDQYSPVSIKNLERQSRSVAGGLLVTINRPDQKLPAWKKYLAVSANKVAVAEFTSPVEATSVCCSSPPQLFLCLP